MRILNEKNREKLHDFLSRRLHNAHALCVRYRALLDELARAEPALRRVRPGIETHLVDAREVAGWLEGELRSAGAVAIASASGRELLKPAPDVRDELRALLAAELAEERGWGRLHDLALAARDARAIALAERWRRRARDHAAHLDGVLRSWLLSDLFGSPVTLPVP